VVGHSDGDELNNFWLLIWRGRTPDHLIEDTKILSPHSESLWKDFSMNK
jgi:hypothetical protein